MEEIKIKMKKHMDLFFMGDLHFPRGKYNLFKQEINKISKQPDSYFIGMGDWVEGILPGDKRYNPEETAFMIKKYGTLVNMISEQYHYIEDALQLLADNNQIIGIHNGNHERPGIRNASVNELRRICDRFNTKYLGEGCAIITLQNSHDINILTAHGIGGGILPGFAYNNLDKHSNVIDGIDIIAEGHTHKLGVDISEDHLKHGKGKFKHRTQWRCSCGSFLGNYDLGYSSYAELKMYRPLPLGYVRVTIEDFKIKNDGVVAIPV